MPISSDRALSPHPNTPSTLAAASASALASAQANNTSDPPADFTRFEGRAAFAQACKQMLQTAKAENWPRLTLCDHDFKNWPLSDADFVQGLEDWSHSGRQFLIVAGDYRVIEAEFPRFVRWRRQWDHIVQAVAVAPAHRGSGMPSVILGGGWALHRVDAERERGYLSHEAAPVHQLQEVLDEMLLKAHSAFPASTIGL